jgi:PAS domain S-box-containing protein
MAGCNRHNYTCCIAALSLGNSSVPARIAATVAVLLALATLCGWAFNLRPLTSLIPGAVEMKVNTATCLLLCGIALLVLSDRATTRLEGAARAAAVLAFLIGLATLAEYLFEWQLGIDELVLKDVAGSYNVFRGRMSPFTATALIVLGFAVAGIRVSRTDRMARVAAGIGMSIGLLSLIGYLWNAGDIVTDRLLPPVALNTALCLVAIGLGVLLTGEKLGGAAPRVRLAEVEIKILVGFIAAVFLLIAGGSFTYRNSVEFANSVQWIGHTQDVRTSLADLYGSLAGAEVATRDYFLTKERAPLDEANRLVLRARDNLQNLGRLVSDNPQQFDHLSTLRSFVEHRLETLNATQTAFKDYGVPAVRAILTLSRHASTVEDVRAQVDRMDAIEKHLLDARQASSARARSVTLISLLITLILAVSLFIALFRGIHREMFARRNAERALRDSDQYNRSILDSSPDCLSVLTTGAHVTQMNPVGMQLLGVEDFTAIAGKDWCALWNEDAQQAARIAVAQARAGQSARFNGATAQGASEKWWDVIVMPIRSTGGQPERLLAVARDITEVKRTEAELVEANRFLDSLIESLPVMVVVKDAKELRFIRHNRMFEQMLGMTREQIAGKTAYEILKPDEAELTVSTDRKALDSGELVDISERSVFTPAGVKILNTKKVPIFGSDGKAHFLLAISSDITEVKLSGQAIRELNAELQGKAAQLESTNRELESFSYSVSHDLRAPLRAIDGFAEIIEEDYNDKLDDECKRYLSVIRQNSRRMGELIDDLLAFSRLGRQTVARGEVNIDSLVREVINEIESGHAAGGRTGAKTPVIEVGPLPPALGDRTLLRQVWTNLISNAIKYSSKTAEPRIEIQGSASNDENQYSVRDNGVGFNMDYVAKLFGVFQRLHRADEFAGTGVGLAIVHRIVSRHGGKVWAEGKINEGAVFSFSLPRGSASG